jgi:hypothetical protein
VVLAMDDEVKNLLRQILLVQQEQAAVIKRYLPPLWTKIRFSLLALLLAMTATAIGMGLAVYTITNSKPMPPVVPAPARVIFPPPTAPQGTPLRPGQPKLISPPSVPRSPVASAAKEFTSAH